jgi:hypothetical protein
MSHHKEKKEISAKEYALKIFKEKDEFHKRQAKLPIEEKVRILVELQKIVLKMNKKAMHDDTRRVWKLE